MTRLEQIELLREKANVTYDEANHALDEANGDLLDAIILLEKQGKVNPPNGGGYYSSANTNSVGGDRGTEKTSKTKSTGESFTEMLDKIGKFCVKVINKGNSSTFEVLKEEESKAKVPVTVLALLLIFLPWITIPLTVIGFLVGYRYRFNGIHLGDES